MTKILYIPFGIYLMLPSKNNEVETEIFEESFAAINSNLMARETIEFLCGNPWCVANHMFIHKNKLSDDFVASVEEFEIIYD
jgi:hypothetical protein